MTPTYFEELWIDLQYDLLYGNEKTFEDYLYDILYGGSEDESRHQSTI